MRSRLVLRNLNTFSITTRDFSPRVSLPLKGYCDIEFHARIARLDAHYRRPSTRGERGAVPRFRARTG